MVYYYEQINLTYLLATYEWTILELLKNNKKIIIYAQIICRALSIEQRR